jgi:V8-like Glu-specific endopeptidase
LDEEREIPVVITNKHVVEGAASGKFLVHTAITENGRRRPSGYFFNLEFAEFEPHWIFHPSADVDLCAMPMGQLRAAAEKLGHSIYTCPLGDEHILPDSKLSEFKALEEIVMVGYPRGIWDSTNNFPLIRKGVTASHPAVDFCGKSITVVDIACFPGSSGSPVLRVNEQMYHMSAEGTVTEAKAGGQAFLLGVLFEGPTMTAAGDIIISEIPTVAKPVAYTQVMMHLGHIIKAKEVLVLGEQVKSELLRRGAIQ